MRSDTPDHDASTAAPLTTRRTLRGRLVVSFLTISLATIALLAGVAFYHSRATLQDVMFERLTTVVTVDEGVLNRWVSGQESAIRFLANVPQVATGLGSLAQLPKQSDAYAVERERLEQLLIQASRHADLQEVMLLLPLGGEVIASTERENVGEYYVDALFFTEGKTRTYTQNLYASPITSRPTVTIATPVLSPNGDTVGVLAGHLNLARIDQMLAERTGLGRTAEVYLVSAFNDFVSSERFGRVEHGRGVHSEGVDAAVSGKTGVGKYVSYRGVPVMGAYAWLADRDLALIVEMEQAEAFAPARRLAFSILAAGMLAVFLLTSAVRLVARQIAGPVATLSEAAHRVAAGDFDVSAPVSSEDEIGALATSFNRMTGKLRLVYGDLRRQVETTQHALEGLARARDEAESATRAKSEFLARMSHEIRTPLNAVLGMAHLLEQTRLDHAQRDYATKIRRSGSHLLTVINEILDFSKLEANRVELESLTFDLHDLLDDLTARVPAPRDTVDVVFHVRADVPRALVGDPLRLGQVLANLLNNATKFTHEGQIHLLAELDTRSVENIVVRFSIRDTGIGVEQSRISHLFAPFTQEDESTTRRYGGTGLGLSICRQLVDLMGGELHVDSEPGRGSTFSFTARFGLDEAAVMADHREPALVGARIGVSIGHELTRAALVELLEGEGIQVTSGPTGTGACLDAMILDWPSSDTKTPTSSSAPTIHLVKPHRILDATSGSNAVRSSRCLATPITRRSLVSRLLHVLPRGERDTGKDRPPDHQALVGSRVLVVEDNPINQEIAREVLAQAGATVSIASHGLGALDRLENQTYDVMLLDIQMPGMNGFDVAQRVRSDPRHRELSIIVLSADPALESKALRAHDIHSYLTKPVEPSVLLEKVATAIGLDQGRDEGALDFRSGVERAAGNERLYRKLLLSFIDQQRGACHTLSRALDDGDLESAERRLHNLKGVAANLGATGVSDAAARALADVRAGRPLELEELGAALVLVEAAVAARFEPDAALAGADSKAMSQEARP